jgi:hypothetical protein
MSGTNLVLPIHIVSALIAKRKQTLFAEAEQHAVRLDEITLGNLLLDEIMTAAREVESKIQRTNATVGHLVVLSGLAKRAADMGITEIAIDLESAAALGLRDDEFHARWAEGPVAVIDGAIDRLNKSVQSRQNPVPTHTQGATGFPGFSGLPNFPGIEMRNPLLGEDDEDE